MSLSPSLYKSVQERGRRDQWFVISATFLSYCLIAKYKVSGFQCANKADINQNRPDKLGLTNCQTYLSTLWH